MNNFSRLDFDRPLTICPYILNSGITEPLANTKHLVVDNNIELFTMQLANSRYGEEVFKNLQCMACDEEGNNFLSSWLEVAEANAVEISSFFKAIGYTEIGEAVESWIRQGEIYIYFDWYEKPNLDITSLYTLSFQIIPEREDFEANCQRYVLVGALSLAGAEETIENANIPELLQKALDLLAENKLEDIKIPPTKTIARIMFDRFFLIDDKSWQERTVKILKKKLKHFIKDNANV